MIIVQLVRVPAVLHQTLSIQQATATSYKLLCPNYKLPTFSKYRLFQRRRRRGGGGGGGSVINKAISDDDDDDPVTAAAAAAGAGESGDINVREVEAFDPSIPIEDHASTNPTSWYTFPHLHHLELKTVFYNGWRVVGYAEQIAEPYDYFTGRLGRVDFIVSRDSNGGLHAFHNVCRHHHTSLVPSQSGKKHCFVCPYHGWTYGLDGELVKATRSSGIKNFKAHEHRLVPITVAVWGPFVLVNLGNKFEFPGVGNVADKCVGSDWLGSCSGMIATECNDAALQHLCRREYDINCNWKVYCDNYLDGGYHVPYAHGGLAADLNLDSYSINVYEKVSIQQCETISSERSNNFDRLGSKAMYAFVYPNFMINRYGPWMDTNLVIPTGCSSCKVIFDYFLDDVALKDDKNFVERSLRESERIQMEDIKLCESVQKGIESPVSATFRGCYNPTVEMAMHHFHCLLHQDLSSLINSNTSC